MTAELRKKKEELEKKLTYANNNHASFHKHISNEGAYRESCEKMWSLRDQLAEVCAELGEPIPHLMKAK